MNSANLDSRSLFHAVMDPWAISPIGYAFHEERRIKQITEEWTCLGFLYRCSYGLHTESLVRPFSHVLGPYGGQSSATIREDKSRVS